MSMKSAFEMFIRMELEKKGISKKEYVKELEDEIDFSKELLVYLKN